MAMFDLAATAAPEAEDVPGHRSVFLRYLHIYAHAVETVAYVCDIGYEPDFGS